MIWLQRYRVRHYSEAPCGSFPSSARWRRSGPFACSTGLNSILAGSRLSTQGLRTTFPWVFWGFHGKYKIFI